MKSNEPAFPVCTEMILIPIYDDKGNIIGNKSIVTNKEGMSLRDYFAAKAMQSLIHSFGVSSTMEYIVALSYAYADAMIAEREK